MKKSAFVTFLEQKHFNLKTYYIHFHILRFLNNKIVLSENTLKWPLMRPKWKDIFQNLIYFHLQETLQKNGYINKGSYEGWYCVSDEAFLSENDVTEITEQDGSIVKVSYHY